METAVAHAAEYPSVEDILARVEPPLSHDGADIVRKAYEMGRKAHEGQRRRSGEPYFMHCAEVGAMLARMVNDAPTIAAGLLHDTIEDCGITAKDIRAQIPGPVADLVDGVTKISKLHFDSDRERQAGNLRKMILAMASDVRVVLIKLCDRLHNMRTLDHLSPDRQKAISNSTIEIYAPLAKRLGMERIAGELEDLAMQYQHPIFYRRLSEHLERNKANYEGMIAKSKAVVEAALSKAHVHARVYGRIKHIYSIYLKMARQGLTLDEIHDLIAIRVITNTVSESYEALGIVHSRWKPVPGRFKDYIASPKINGYQSLHTTVIGVGGEILEIQIRTKAMHEAAEEGIASHWKYKEAGSPEKAEISEAEKLNWLRQLVDWLSDIRDPQEFMAAVKQNVFEATVFCYTPKGDVMELPTGSTALDFAFRIHTDVGFHCVGAKVNHKMVPLRTVLKTGDIVEIITSKSAHPTPDWVQIAHSSRAKNKIRHWLKTNQRDIYLDRGRSMYLDALRQRGLDLPYHEAMEKAAGACKRFSLTNLDDLLIEVGFGTIKAGVLVSAILPPDAPKSPPKKRPPTKKQKAIAADALLVEGFPGALTRIAHCCSPKPGEPVTGFVTQGRGISVHKTDCPALARYQRIHGGASGRTVRVQWGEEIHRLMNVNIRVVCMDRQGLLTDITQAIAQLGFNITSANTQSNAKSSRAILKLGVQVPDEDALNALLKRLESVPSVRSLSRIVR